MSDLTPAVIGPRSLDHYTDLLDDPHRLLDLNDVDFNTITKNAGERAGGAVQQVRYIGGVLTWAAKCRYAKDADYSRWLTRASAYMGVTVKTLGEWRKAVQESEGLPDTAAIPSKTRQQSPRPKGQTEKISVRPEYQSSGPTASDPPLEPDADKPVESGEPEVGPPASGSAASKDVVEGAGSAPRVLDGPDVAGAPGDRRTLVAPATPSGQAAHGAAGEPQTVKSVGAHETRGLTARLALPDYPTADDMLHVVTWLSARGRDYLAKTPLEALDRLALEVSFAQTAVRPAAALAAADRALSNGSLVRREVQSFQKAKAGEKR